MAVERDPETFSSYEGGAFIGPVDEGTRLMMINQDPPRHTRLRKLVSRMFTPRHIRSIEGHVRTAAKEIVDRAAPQGEIDFVTEVAADLPLIVIAELIGVPQEDRHKVFEWSNKMVGAEDPEYGADSDVQEVAAELYTYAQRLADERLADPGEDIVTLLLTGEVDGEKLDVLEFNVFFLLLAVAGNETTRNLITGGTLALLEHDDQREQFLSQPDVLAPSVEEMLRYVSPVNYFRRTATRAIPRFAAFRSRTATRSRCGTRLRTAIPTSSRTRTRSTSTASRTTMSPSVDAARTSASAPTSPATRSTACSRSCAGSCPTWSSPAPSSGCT